MARVLPPHRRVPTCNNFGEQVPVAVKHGWLDLVADDLEAIGYAFGSMRAEASMVGAPIARERLFFVAEHIRARMARQFSSEGTRCARPWKWRGEEDLRPIYAAPFVGNGRWPEPLVRRVDHGFSGAVGAMQGYGNAVVPQVAADL